MSLEKASGSSWIGPDEIEDQTVSPSLQSMGTVTGRMSVGMCEFLRLQTCKV